MRPLRRRFLALLFLPLLVVAACSDDDGGDTDAASTSSSSTSSTSSTTTTIGALDADDVDASASPYCATWKEIRALGGPPLGGTPEEQAEARRAHYAELVPLAERLVEQADEEIEESAEFALAQVREVAETGSTDAFEGEDARRHQQALAAYAQEHCAA